MSASQSPVKPRLAASDRLLNVPPYALAKLFQDRDSKLRQGVDVLDLGVGNPDIRPPQVALDGLQAALVDPKVQTRPAECHVVPDVSFARSRRTASFTPMCAR